MPINYKKGKIYKIYSLSNDDLIYYGSTVNKLCVRYAKHKFQYKNKMRASNSKIIFDNCDDHKIELVEEYPCDNIEQLRRREGFYIKNNKCLNKNVAGRTPKEWREDNKKIIKKKSQIYYKKNRMKKIKQCEKYYLNNKEKYKKYYLNNEKHKEYCKKYYLENKKK